MPYVSPKPTPREAITAGIAMLAPVFEMSPEILALDPEFLDAYTDLEIDNPGVPIPHFSDDPLLDWQVRIRACEHLLVASDAIATYIEAKTGSPGFDPTELQELYDTVRPLADEAEQGVPGGRMAELQEAPTKPGKGPKRK